MRRFIRIDDDLSNGAHIRPKRVIKRVQLSLLQVQWIIVNALDLGELLERVRVLDFITIRGR